jgi:hypothetical protein
MPKRLISQEPHSDASQEAQFFKVTAVNTTFLT